MNRMPRTEVRAISVVSFQINSWHAQSPSAGEFFHLKSTVWLNWPMKIIKISNTTKKKSLIQPSSKNLEFVIKS